MQLPSSSLGLSLRSRVRAYTHTCSDYSLLWLEARLFMYLPSAGLLEPLDLSKCGPAAMLCRKGLVQSHGSIQGPVPPLSSPKEQGQSLACPCTWMCWSDKPPHFPRGRVSDWERTGVFIYKDGNIRGVSPWLVSCPVGKRARRLELSLLFPRSWLFMPVP